MQKSILLFLLSFFIANGAYSQYNLKFKIEGLKDTTIFLARYRGERLYYIDTTKSIKGVVNFKKDYYEGGIYAVVCPGPAYFEFIMEDKIVEMETTLKDFINDMKVKKSENNRVFFEYMEYMKNKRNEQKACGDNKDCLTKLNDEVKAYQYQICDLHKDKLISKILKMSIEIDIPKEIESNDSLKYIYYKNHYWDNVDLSDKRMIRTPVFDKKLKFYYEKVLIQHPDTICENSQKIVDQMEKGSDMFMHTVHYITYKYETSKIMGMDGVFHCMAEKYYCPADKSSAFWINEEKLNELCDRSKAVGPLLIGKPAPRVILADTSEQNWIDFYTQVKAKKTVLIFWADDCGHCKKEIPKLLNLYHELKEKKIDVEFIAIGTSLENKGWKKFIKEKKLDWINISDFPAANDNAGKYIYELQVTDLKSLNFRKTYDIFSTPQVYLLDENKIIEGKKLDAKNLATLIEKKMNVELKFNDDADGKDSKSKNSDQIIINEPEDEDQH